MKVTAVIPQCSLVLKKTNKKKTNNQNWIVQNITLSQKGHYLNRYLRSTKESLENALSFQLTVWSLYINSRK